MDVVSTFKYLRLRVDNKLVWTSNTQHLYKKGRRRLYFLRRLQSFSNCRIFYKISAHV